MFYLCGLFGGRNKLRPYLVASFDPNEGEVKFYSLFFPGTGMPLDKVYKNYDHIQELIKSEDVILNNCKQFIRAFELDESYELRDLGFPPVRCPEKLNQAKMSIATMLKDMIKSKPQNWQKILANAQFVYKNLEDKGFYLDWEHKFPEYEITFSGRSKCLGTNIQGAKEGSNVKPSDIEQEFFIHLDWIAADLRVASLLSKDDSLDESFKYSDPYTVLYEAIDNPEVTREQCKKQLFGSLYSLNSEGLNYYDGLANWIESESNRIHELGYGESILGRKFYLGKERTVRSIFNAQTQGSVAHAMQNVLFHTYQKFPNNVLTEVYDSLILTCRKSEISDIIQTVSQIMLYPFDGVLKYNPKFPLKISIGKEWKKWKFYKEVR